MLVLVAAIGITTVLVSWLFVSYRQRMEFLKGSIENDLFDAVQHVFLKELQGGAANGMGKTSEAVDSGLIDSIKVKFPDLAADKIGLLIHEIKKQEQKNFRGFRPYDNKNQEKSQKDRDPKRLLPPPFIRGMPISEQSLAEIKDAFDKRLKDRNLDFTYKFSVGDPGPREFPKVRLATFFQQGAILLRPLMIDPDQNKFILVKVEHSWKFFLFAMSWQLIISLLILTILLGSFVYLFLTIFRQNKLNIIRKSLIHSMSHELRTPVTTAKVALEAMEDFVAPNNHELRSSYNAMAREDLQHLSDMLDKVLEIANLEGKSHTPLDIRPINLHEFLSPIVEHFKLLHKNDDLIISLHTEAGTFIVLADAHHLKNVFNNLLDNAVKYGASEINITIKLRPNDKMVQVEVQDNGIGIPPEYYTEVFEPFFRVSGGNLYEVKGFGLGLSYVKQIMNKHKGLIKVKSADGHGCTFILTIPKAN